MSICNKRKSDHYDEGFTGDFEQDRKPPKVSTPPSSMFFLPNFSDFSVSSQGNSDCPPSTSVPLNSSFLRFTTALTAYGNSKNERLMNMHAYSFRTFGLRLTYSTPWFNPVFLYILRMIFILVFFFPFITCYWRLHPHPSPLHAHDPGYMAVFVTVHVHALPLFSRSRSIIVVHVLLRVPFWVYTYLWILFL